MTTVASLHAASKALEQNGDFSEFLTGRVFSSPVGSFSFDENGDIVGLEQVLKVIREGKPALLSQK